MRIKAFVIILTVLLFSKSACAYSKLFPNKHHKLELELTLEGAVFCPIIFFSHRPSCFSEFAIGGEIGIPFAHDSLVFRLGIDGTVVTNPTIFVGLTASSSVEQNIGRYLSVGIGILFSRLFYPTELIEGGFGPIIRLQNTRLMHSLRVVNIALFPALVVEREQKEEKFNNNQFIISGRMALQINFDLFKL